MKFLLPSATVVTALSASFGVSAFSFPAPHTPRQFATSMVSFGTSTTALCLLPTQGAQLAAASSCAYDDKLVARIEAEAEDLVPPTAAKENSQLQHHTNKISSTRSFVSRVFSLPATVLHPKEKDPKDSDEDSLVYPVVGFKFVRDQSDLCRALPTISNPSCRLAPPNEPLFGYYSPACHLDCSASEDEVEKYSQMPNHAQP